MSRIVLETDAGNITLALLPHLSPMTCAHVARHVKEGLYAPHWHYRLHASPPSRSEEPGRAALENTHACNNFCMYDGVCFYRSDIVLQMGIHATGRTSAHAALAVNESRSYTDATR